MRFCHLLAGVMTIGLAAGTTLALDSAVRTWTWPVWAQEAQRISITVAPLIHAAPEARTPLSIQVGAQNLLPKDCFIRVRGLPPFVALSDGHAIGSGSWSVPLPAGPGLVIFVPNGTQGRSEVVIDVLNSDGSVFAEARTELAIAPVALVHGHHRNMLSAGPGRPDLDPSPLAAIRKGFEAFLAQRTLAAAQKGGPKSALTPDQYDEMWSAPPRVDRVRLRI